MYWNEKETRLVSGEGRYQQSLILSYSRAEKEDSVVEENTCTTNPGRCEVPYRLEKFLFFYF